MTVPEGKHSLVSDTIEALMIKQVDIANSPESYKQPKLGEEAFRTANTLNVLYTIVREQQAPTPEVVTAPATV